MPFEETRRSGRVKFGFRLLCGDKIEDFFTESTADLDEWLRYLPSLMINYSVHEDLKIGPILGEGSVATVYSALDLETDSAYAVKMVPKSCIENERRARMLLSEIKIQKRLHHPNIVSMYRVYEDPTHIALTLDLVTGKSLIEIMQERRRMSEPEAACIIEGVL
jgi:serine/threonine protein kinase